MDNEQAKLALSAYRPGGEDASDPLMAEALEQAARDPELSGWLAGEIRFDRGMQAAIRSQEPPANLRERLLLGRRVVSLHRLEPDHPQSERRLTGWLALAAALAVLAVLGLFFRADGGTAPTAGQLAAGIMQMAGRGEINLGKMSSDPAELRAWLAAQGSPHDFPIPEKLQGLQGMGCQSFVIDGAKVSLVCFMLDQNRMVHLFVVDDSSLREVPGETPRIVRDGTQVAATWSARGRTFLLTGMNIDEATLRRFI